ncbi:MAG: AbrB family transcriptional regulator [Candidatus Accumulibacter sp.]|nr:AbrB family transcriptional regulator [Accumulibacter sp.]
MLHSLKPYVLTLTLSVAAGILFKLLHVPLPWMVGPMFAVGASGVRGSGPKAIPGSRQAGQLVIGCSLGLYFTNEVSRQMLDFGAYIFFSSFAGIVIGATGALLFKRISGTSAISSYFASIPGGATEMAILAEHAGARFDLVAFSHSIRILLVVLTVPIAVTLSGAVGSSLFEPSSSVFVPKYFLGMFCIAVVASFLFARLRIPNAWLLAPLIVSLSFTTFGLPTSSIPTGFVNAAQILIGCSLGTRFKPSLRTESRRLIVATLLTALFTIVVSAAFGVALALMMDESPAALILATSPGGLSEMCITAKILKLGVPLVTSFQVARLVVVVLFSLPLWRGLVWLKERARLP